MRGDTDTRVLTELGEVFEAARARHGFTVSQVAKKAGLAAATWSNTIRGGGSIRLNGISRFRPWRPSDETVRAFALALGLKLTEVMNLPREAVTKQTLCVSVDLSDVPTDALLEELKRRAA